MLRMMNIGCASAYENKFCLCSACTMFKIYHAAHDEHRLRLGIRK